ncbi:hypothetical protein R9C00_02605 [Flammeovirgaceae bacterium SG7u.111]|nr:hypothetical protein [Flammeovirgaceae bacterium SG7u.132]WPO36331.1 hypothetical protein R9C00_02605 [Flammeovirgaceae bacterium SG7u.111]
MNTYFKNLKTLALVFFLLSLLVSCKEDEVEIPEDQAVKIQIISNGSFGNILVNQKNQSLYFFAGDVTGTSNCNGGCAEVWPPLVGEVNDMEFGGGLDKSDFSTTVREDGQKQITYKGWPLYYFSPEGDGELETPNEISGDGKNGVFYVGKPDYTVMLGRKSVTEGADPVIYLIDNLGVSLYESVKDETNVSNCNGGCAEVWPPFAGQENPIVPSTLSKTDFKIINREDGLGYQLTYKGSPLYHFTPDEQTRGNVKGQGGAGETFFVNEPL